MLRVTQFHHKCHLGPFVAVGQYYQHQVRESEEISLVISEEGPPLPFIS